MISYRQADILRSLEVQQNPIQLEWFVGYKEAVGTQDPLGTSYCIKLNRVECSDKEILNKSNILISEILSGSDFVKYPSKWQKCGFESMQGAEYGFMGLIQEIKDHSNVKSVKNNMSWISGTRNKIMNMEITLRG